MSWMENVNEGVWVQVWVESVSVWGKAKKNLESRQTFGLNLTTWATSGWSRRNLSMTASILNSGNDRWWGLHLHNQVAEHSSVAMSMKPFFGDRCRLLAQARLTSDKEFALFSFTQLSDITTCHPGRGNGQECSIRQKEAEANDSRVLQGVCAYLHLQCCQK